MEVEINMTFNKLICLVSEDLTKHGKLQAAPTPGFGKDMKVFLGLPH